MNSRILLSTLLCLASVEAHADPSDRSSGDERLRAAVVRLEVEKVIVRHTDAGNPQTTRENALGAGFWLGGTHRIVTCAHVLEGARRINVFTYSQWMSSDRRPWSTERNEVSICLTDEKRDIAMLEVPGSGQGLPLATSVSQARDVTAVGHTENFPWRINHGEISGRQPANTFMIPVEGDVLVCDVSFGPGASGGIVVDADDHILGMIEGGKSRGAFGTRVAVPCDVIRQVTQPLEAKRSCQGFIASRSVIVADEDRFNDIPDRSPKAVEPGRFWAQLSFGYLDGIDRFGDSLVGWQLGLVDSRLSRLSWALTVQGDERRVERPVSLGILDAEDDGWMRRWSATVGPRLRVTDVGRVSLYGQLGVGAVHDRMTHDYAFSSELFAPQSHERSITGGLVQAAAIVEIQVVTNLRVTWRGELWQGSGGIGNGIGQHAGLTAGLGHARL